MAISSSSPTSPRSATFHGSRNARSFFATFSTTTTMKTLLTLPVAILKRQLARLKERGYLAYFASELEFYLFDETYETARAKHWKGMATASPYIQDYVIQMTTKEDAVHARRSAMACSMRVFPSRIPRASGVLGRKRSMCAMPRRWKWLTAM